MIDREKIEEILDRGNTAEIKKNKQGDTVILEVKRKIKYSDGKPKVP